MHFRLSLAIFNGGTIILKKSIMPLTVKKMVKTDACKSWKQHPTKEQLYGYLTPITKSIQKRRTRHEGHYWRLKDVLFVTFPHGPLHMDVPMLSDQEHTDNRSQKTHDIVWKTCRNREMIETNSE